MHTNITKPLRTNSLKNLHLQNVFYHRQFRVSCELTQSSFFPLPPHFSFHVCSDHEDMVHICKHLPSLEKNQLTFINLKNPLASHRNINLSIIFEYSSKNLMDIIYIILHISICNFYNFININT